VTDDLPARPGTEQRSRCDWRGRRSGRGL
jgi:hypothetical protein